MLPRIMPSRLDRPLAFVDIETTGSTATRDRITEVAVITWDGETASIWSQLVNPDTRVPNFIEAITGISNTMLEDAPPVCRDRGGIGAAPSGPCVRSPQCPF